MTERADAGVTTTPAPKLVVVGQGYVGLPIAMRAVEVGYDTVGVDVNESRVKRVADGDSYIEDVGAATVRSALATGRYLATTAYDAAADFDFAVITVPTPLREGLPDLSFIEQAAESLAPHLRSGATVVLESTTYPGTTDKLLVPILENASRLRAGYDFHVGYSPERIDPGNPMYGFVNTPKVISGINDDSLTRVEHLYRSLVNDVVVVSNCKVAELTKLLENTFRHVNIALVNELAMFAYDLGIDVWEAIDASSTKPFGYMRFTPGPGVGGHCLPVDPSYLSWQVKRTLGTPFRFVELANDVNDHMPKYVVHRITGMLNRKRKPVMGSRVLLVGLAYKQNTSDVRESPAVKVAELLLASGADVVAADPHVDAHDVPKELTLVSLTPEEVSRSDIAVILTSHDCLDLEPLDHAASVFDTRHTAIARAPNVELL